MGRLSRATAVLFNHFARGKIHVGSLPLPVAVAYASLRRARRKVGIKMSLRYANWPPSVSPGVLTFDGSGTDWATLISGALPAGSPAPEALAFIQFGGTFSADPGVIHCQLTDANGDLCCALPDLPAAASLDQLRSLSTILTNIAGRAGLTLEISTANACTLSASGTAATGFILWEE